MQDMYSNSQANMVEQKYFIIKLLPNINPQYTFSCIQNNP